MSDLSDLLRAGDLDALRAALTDRVRTDPSTPAHRVALAEILIVRGELDRADAQLDLAAAQDTSLAVTAALTRQLIRAAVAREQAFAERRAPELVSDMDAGLTTALARLAGAGEAFDERVLAGERDGARFAGLRDGDDRTAEVLEVLTTTGKYVWVSLAQIATLSLVQPSRPRDLVWRQAELEVRGGPGGVVYLPAIYPAAAMTDAQRLGRETDWVEAGAFTEGRGLRTFLLGEEAVTLAELTTLAIDP